MKKKVEEIENKISAVEQNLKKRYNARQSDYKETVKKHRELSDKINSVTDPEEFKKVTKELEEIEVHWDYLKRFFPIELEKGFTEEEYRIIIKDLQAEICEVKEERAEELLKAVKKAMVLMSSLVREVDMIDDVMRHADMVHYGRTVSRRFDITNVYKDNRADKEVMDAFCRAYYLNAKAFNQISEEETV